MSNLKSVLAAGAVSILASLGAAQANMSCGETYSVVAGDTLSKISLRAYGSFLYQPIYTQNIDVIGSNPDMIYVGQTLLIPCLSAEGTILADASDEAVIEGQLVFTFNKASAPPFIINSGIIDKYLADVTEVTEGRVVFVDPEVINRDREQQLELVSSGAVDGAYVLNSTLASSHPLLQIAMQPMFGGSAEQTAVSMWRLHDAYLSQSDYFPEAHLLGFVAAPAAHIWRDASAPVTTTENIAGKNVYSVPYFNGLDTRGPAAMREELAGRLADYKAQNSDAPTFFLAHGAALAIGLWNENSTVSVMEVDNGVYTPTFSVILSNEAWAQISPEDQAAIREISGEALAHRSSAWDDFDNAFRKRMLDLGLNFKKAEKALADNLWLSSLGDLNAWIDAAEARGIPGVEATNFYLASLRSLENTLIYRGDESFVDQHPYLTGGN